jgi:hypothetical protein
VQFLEDEMKFSRSTVLLVVAILSQCPQAFCDDVVEDDVRQLKDEATATLKANSIKTVPFADYAMAIYRLEKAQSMLEQAKDTESGLAQEINSALFWARRCSNVNILKELDKIHASSPPLKLASQDPKPKAEKKMVAADELEEVDAQKDAKAAFEAAQEFAKTHADDDFMVAMRWFEMVNKYPGTDYSMKAVGLAREAQLRFAAKSGAGKKEEIVGEGPELKPIEEGDKLCDAGKLLLAIESYKASLRVKDNILAHRRLGHTYYKYAQQRKDEINKEFDDFVPQYKAAYDASWEKVGQHGKKFNELSPVWLAAKRKHSDIINEANGVLMIYASGQYEFEKILKLSPNNRDFDAAAYLGVSLSARIDSKMRATTHLKSFLKDYEPSDDIERFIYEYCKTELQRISTN